MDTPRLLVAAGLLLAASCTTVPDVPPLLGGDTGIDHWPETVVTFEAEPDGLAIAAKVAATPERRRQGLMRVPDVPDGVGMLFLFEEPNTGGFWMKDTLVALDIAYVADGEVVAIMQMEPCRADPCPTYDPGTRYDAAVEVRQSTFEQAGVDVGAQVTWTEPEASGARAPRPATTLTPHGGAGLGG